jgi:hypothetical protein
MIKYLTFHAASYKENSHNLLQALTGVTQLYKVRCRSGVTSCCDLFSDARSPVILRSEVNWKYINSWWRQVVWACIKVLFQYCLEKMVQTRKSSLVSIANLRRRLNQGLLNTKQKCNPLDCGVQLESGSYPYHCFSWFQSPVASTGLVLATVAYVTSYSPSFTTLGLAWLSYLRTLSVVKVM